MRLDGFWRALREDPVPVREEAVRAIGARSLALDVYIWLAHRPHTLTRPALATSTALHAQFGAGSTRMPFDIAPVRSAVPAARPQSFVTKACRGVMSCGRAAAWPRDILGLRA